MNRLQSVVPRAAIFAVLFVFSVLGYVGQIGSLAREASRSLTNQLFFLKAGQTDGLPNLAVAADPVWQMACPPPVINGRLGAGSADYPSVSGVLLGRLSRNGVASACNAPKTCSLASGTGARAYDAYTFKNNGSAQVCATITLTLPQQVGANYQANSYLGSFDPNNICANYLADPGVSSATLSDPIVYSHNVPAGATFVVVVQTTNPGEIDGIYQLKVEGLANCANVCALNCPANLTAATTGNSTPVNYALPTLAGNCQGASTVTCVPPSGSTFAVGTTPVNCSARDASNNTIGCSFNVLVNKLTSSISGSAGCLGAGDVVNASFTVTNSASSVQTVTATATLPPQLLAIGGRCTSNVGTAGNCTVTSPSSVVFTATLAAGQTATITYPAQVADSAVKGTQLCINTFVNFNGGLPATAQSCVTVTCDPVGEGKPLSTQFSGSDARAGSVLIFPIYTSIASSGQTQNTRLSLTNLDPARSSIVHLFLIDASSCEVRDAFVCLTPNQTTAFLASDIDPGTTGFIVVVAVDQQGCPINFNQLIGDEYVKLSSGHTANLGADAIPAVAGGLAACNVGGVNSATAALRFDGNSYAPLPRVVAADGFASRADGNETMLILNRIGGNLATGGTTTSAMTSLVYDDSENAYSLTFNLTCQYRGSVWTSTRATPRFDTVIPSGRSGWAKYYSNADEAFLGATINLNRNFAAQANAFSAGHNLHKLSYTTSAVYTIPVTPPSC